jgi:deoxycytidine triphosphate deaminase
MSVLSADEIKGMAEQGELILNIDFNSESLRPASYDVTVAQDGLIEPSGKAIKPGAKNWTRRGIVLTSGDTAVFSTKERFCMPGWVAGNLTVRNGLAQNGLALLSGALIDPGYGLSADESPNGSRLFLHVANLGKDPIVVRPGREKLARVQFLRLATPPSPEYFETERARWHGHKPESRWEDQRLASLGFFSEMKRLREEVERNVTRSRDIVLFGLVVLAVALIGAELTALLTLASNTSLLKDVKKVIRGDEHEYLLWAGLFVGLPLAAIALALWARGVLNAVRWSWLRRPRLRRG